MSFRKDVQHSRVRQRGDWSRDAVHVVEHGRGHAAVLRAQPVLLKLAKRYDQLDVVQDLSYFLQKPGLTRRTPHVVLVAGENDARPEDARGALLVHESRPLGVPTGAFAVSDRSGRGVVLARPDERVAVALRASAHLMRSGGNLVLLTIQTNSSVETVAALIEQEGLRRTQWAVRTRPCPSFLPLCATYDQTLATLGKKTRTNLRYYRRRAEHELGCRFLPEALVSAADLIAFNDESMFPQPRRVMRWRMSLQEQLQEAYVMGMQDGAGRWLSLIGGRRFGTSTEILWQMNREGLPRHSLVSAMRSYLMEHEIERGAERLYIEGGTPHSIQNSFEDDLVTDLVLMRPWLKSAVSQFARRYVPSDNVLAGMLKDPDTVWHAA